MIADIKFIDANKDEDVSFIGEALKKAKTQVSTQAILHEYNRTTKSLAGEAL